ncbi:MAG: hypothetical protein MZV64_43510 [Ignavibacteriales bacterium]|nr:hypothetical protein [Ignavibacteriales bacterium]
MPMKRIPLSPTIGAICLATALALLPVAAQERADKAEPRLKLIFVERFRFEAWDNTVSLDDTAADGTAYTRNRTTLGLDWKPLTNLEVLGKVTNEFRVCLAPKDRAFSWHELFLDNLYVKWTLPGRVLFTVTAGRQDLNFGEGFVIADGTPGDGSRSYYFNALRVDAGLAKGHTLTAFAHATKATDRYLPVVHPKPQALAEQPEAALALYYAGTFGKTKLDAYAIRKTTDANEAWPVPDADRDLRGPGRGPVGQTALPDRRGRFSDGPGRRSRTRGHRGHRPPRLRPHGDPALAQVGRPRRDPPQRRRSFDGPGGRLGPHLQPLAEVERKLHLHVHAREPAVLLEQPVVGLRPARLRSRGPFGRPPHGSCRWGPAKPKSGISPGGPGAIGARSSGVASTTRSANTSPGAFIWEHFTPGSFYFAGASSYNWIQFEFIFRY